MKYRCLEVTMSQAYNGMRFNMNDFEKSLVKKIRDSLIEVYEPEAIYLFGSHAWGNPEKDSDFDFCVVIKSSDCSMAERIRTGLSALSDLNIPIDLIVFTTEEFDSKKEHPSTLMYQVSNRGIKLYEAA